MSTWKQRGTKEQLKELRDEVTGSAERKYRIHLQSEQGHFQHVLGWYKALQGRQMESIAHDFFCFMSKLLWPLFIYYLTVPQRSWCEDQFAVFSLLLLKDTFASWTWPFPISVPGHITHLSLYFQEYPYFYNLQHLASVPSFHLRPHYFNAQYFILYSYFSKIKSIKSQKFWGTGEPGQHGGIQLGLSQPWQVGHLIQTPLSHKGGTHKLTHLIEAFNTKECF